MLPMNPSKSIAKAYEHFAGRRILLYGVTVFLIFLSLIAFSKIRMEENIEAMLPDRGSSVASDFRLLQRAPFARKMLITLESDGAFGTNGLIMAADDLAEALDPELFGKVTLGPQSQMQGRLFTWLVGALPSLLSAGELEAVADSLQGDGMKMRLRENYEQLLSPEGWALKGLIRKDPLALYRMGLERLRFINMIPGMRLVQGHFVSADGKSCLLVAETPIPMTDSAGAKAIEEAFFNAQKKVLPKEVKATLVAGHRYTLANAEAIQGDLWRILSYSTLAILALFFYFFRSFRAGFVFLIPLSVVCVAAVAVSFFFPTVSAVTIGFGAVLLGIAVDFGLHVYFALRRGGDNPATILGEVSRPVVFGALTTMAGFGVLLFSDLPGQRQLAVFSIVGIGVALLLALLVLPHLIPPGGPGGAEAGKYYFKTGLSPRGVLFVWFFLFLLCAWQGQGLEFNGDLRRMSVVPPALAAAEEEVRQTWGDFRGQAMAWAQGSDLEEALERNDRLFELLQEEAPGSEIISLAPLIPSKKVQAQNREGWTAFWSSGRGRGLLERLRRESAALGFSEAAFAPFFKSLEAPASPLSFQGLRDAGLGHLVESLLLEGAEGKAEILTLLPDRPELIEGIEKTFPEGVRVVSQGRFRREISAAIGRDFSRFILMASVAVVLFLILLFRKAEKVFAALIPVATGLAVMFGGMGAFGIEFNLFNVIASILVIGLGVDYGIFMVCKSAEGVDRATDRAVLVSGLTTLAGFGALVLARHPALHSIGITVLLGIGGAIPAALFVIPALYGEKSNA